MLRLRVPERHARFLKAGDPVRIDGEELGEEGAQFGTIRLVYPQIEDGRVVADATVDGLGDYFVGERIRVWISAGERTAFVIPARFITTRFGIDYVQVRKDGTVDRRAGAARARPAASRTCRTAWRFCPGLTPATGWCGREPRTLRATDAGDDPLAIDAVVPAGGAGGRA